MEDIIVRVATVSVTREEQSFREFIDRSIERLGLLEDQLLGEQEALNIQYEQAQTDLSRLQHRSEYMNTEKYIENTAREKFGLVYDNELVFEAR